ncbi:hypothetical protein [Tenacibaculum sp.]|uniref:hypothetical protein n=1 Tax=Tenacibaculum sp. TaxID=1906242 RepID=UPI003AA81DE7
MRLISISWSSNSYHMRVFFKDKPSENDIEIVEEITTEVCSHLSFIEKCKEDNLVWDSDKEKNKLLDETVFMTREHIEDSLVS